MSISNYISISAYRPHRKSFSASICLLGEYHFCGGATKTYKWNWWLYFSRNATPWASTFYFGTNWQEEVRAKIRRKKLGWKFNPHTEELHAELMNINEKYKYL